MSVICFGEILIDRFPKKDLPGGAPMNVAYHLNQMGAEAYIISRIGNDKPGEKLRDFLHKRHMSDALLQVDAEHPTGVVQVDSSNASEVKYTIVESVAWDYIDSAPLLTSALTKDAQYLVHGSLALREAHNRQTLKKLKEISGPRVVFDVNFREPYYEKESILEWMSDANIVKMNEDEFEQMAAWIGITNDKQGLDDLLMQMPKIEWVVITRGGAGAWLKSRHEFVKDPGVPVKVEDTVGSGDTFLAGLIYGLQKGHEARKALHFACKAGAFVATQEGACPRYTIDHIESFGVN